MIGLAFGNFQSGGGGGGFDPDAQAFITAAGITGETQQSALNQLVLDLKGTGSTTNNTDVWSDMQAVYPFCPTDGATATRDGYKWNLKDIRDLDAAFRISWINNPTATTNGIQGNGTNQYGDTNYTPSVDAIDSDASFGFYGTKSSKTDIGTRNTDNNYTAFNNTRVYGCHGRFSNNASLALTNSFCMIQRDNAFNQKIYQSSSIPQATDVQAITSRPDRSYYLMALNSGLPVNYSPETYSFFFIGRSLTSNQIDDFIESIEKYNTSLGR